MCSFMCTVLYRSELLSVMVNSVQNGAGQADMSKTAWPWKNLGKTTGGKAFVRVAGRVICGFCAQGELIVGEGCP